MFFDISGEERLPEEPAIAAGSHCQADGPVFCGLYFHCPFNTPKEAQHEKTGG